MDFDHPGSPKMTISDHPFSGVGQGWWTMVNTDKEGHGIRLLVRLNPRDPSGGSPSSPDPSGPPKRGSKKGPKKGRFLGTLVTRYPGDVPKGVSQNDHF